MSITTAPAPPATRHRSELVRIGYVLLVTMAGTTLPSPLYPLYQQRFGFGAGTTTVVYAVYAAGVLATLLTCGRLSDSIGRRPVLTVALGVSVAASTVFLFAADLPVLLLGRVLSGVAAGLVTACATAAMIERGRPGRSARTSTAAAALTMLGLGLGPLLAGVVATVAPDPLRAPYLVHLGLLVSGVLATRPVHEGRLPGRAAHLMRPQPPRVPVPVRAIFLPSAVAATAAFAAFGLLTAIEPGILHAAGPLLAGSAAFAMFAGSAVGQALTTHWPFRRSLTIGCVVLVIGLILVMLGVTLPSPTALITGTIVVGLGHGSGVRAGTAAVAGAAPPEQRAETVAAFMVVVYLAISVPVVLVGLLSTVTAMATAAVLLIAVSAVLAVAALGILRVASTPRSGDRGRCLSPDRAGS